MKFLLAYTLPILLLTSCFGKKIKSDLTIQPKIAYPDMILNKLEDSYALQKLPFSVDSSFFTPDSVIKYDDGNLSIEEVKFLSENMAFDESSSREKHYLNDFYQIAQAKKDGNYEAFMQKLDIGMTEDASCKTIGRIEFGDTMGIVLWEIKYRSFEACPIYSGQHILATLIKDEKVLYCMNIASKEYGADAPMSYEMYQLANISENATISIRNHSQTMEMDSMVEKSQAYLKYKISAKGFNLIK